MTEELRIPLVLPEGRKAVPLPLRGRGPAERIAALAAGEERFVEALRALDEERATDDPLNGLMLAGRPRPGARWRCCARCATTCCRSAPTTTWRPSTACCCATARWRRALFRSFAARFDPSLAGDRAAAMAEAEAGVRKALEAVRSLAEDEVLRGLDNLVRCRAAHELLPAARAAGDLDQGGQPQGRGHAVAAADVRDLRALAPARGHPPARAARWRAAGIRWSDRHDDFRTEVLGLMKTQMVKNSIIVPVGSKGGFVLKGNVPPRPALDAYLVDRYREFVSGLLDVTDNIVDGKVLHPPEVVRHDGDDPYLVVAADKGTAHLSDTANSVSAQYGFWLGDAFASGGSVGYDHKKMGITARGAWECVKHHFRNLGLDVQTEPFTMRRHRRHGGRRLRQRRAAEPRHEAGGRLQPRCTSSSTPIPTPRRASRSASGCSGCPRSSWRDYDAALISKGGGVFDRSAKAIPLSPGDAASCSTSTATAPPARR